MAAGPLLLEGAWVQTCDAAGTAGRLTVAVEAGRIAAVGPPGPVRRAFPGATTVRCAGRILIPGLINAHLHPDLHVLRGQLEELGLHDWGGGRYDAAVRLLDADGGAALQRAAIRAALVEAVLGGTTTVATYGVTTGAEGLCAAALAELGLNGHITFRDIAFLPYPARRDGPRALPDVASLPPVMYRLHAEETLTVEELQTAAAAHADGARLVMHAAETAHRVALSRERFGDTTIRVLHRHGLLSPRVLLSHAVHVDAAEIALLADTGTAVVVSPAAEMKLADGVPPVVDMLAAGVTVALGTDAAVCNNGTDMFLEMRLLGLSQKLRYGAAALPAEQILLTATRNGAAALGEAERRGSITEGLAADLVLVDAGSPRLQPLLLDGAGSNVAANLVYAATAADVTDVMAGGRWLVRRRRLLTADARAAMRDLAAAARRLHALLGNGNEHQTP